MSRKKLSKTKKKITIIETGQGKKKKKKKKKGDQRVARD
jgi:hypothetical protein